MVNAILALFTAASALGQEPPVPVQSFNSVEACLIEAGKQNVEHADALRKGGAAFACLVVVVPTT